MMPQARPRTPQARPRAARPSAGTAQNAAGEGGVAAAIKGERSTPRLQIPPPRPRQDPAAANTAAANTASPNTAAANTAAANTASANTAAANTAAANALVANTAAANATVAKTARYEPRDLDAVAELARHYLFHGDAEVARVLLEGLTAIAPADARFALALAVTYDRLNLKAGAELEYRRAGELDPAEPRPDIHRAELLLERGDRRDRDEARTLLARGARKAQRKEEREVESKALALLERLDRRGASPR